MNNYKPLYKSIFIPALVTGLLLMIPLVAMQFTDEIVWTLSDFIVAGTLIFGTGLSYKLITKKTTGKTYRIAVGIALFTGFLLIWVNLAVGITGSEDNPFNMYYFGVLAIGLIGAIISRLKSHGMSYSMLAMSLSLAIIAFLVLFGDFYESTSGTVIKIIGIHVFFIALFLVAALFFRLSANEIPENNAA